VSVFNFADYIYERGEVDKINSILGYFETNSITNYENISSRDL
jgi:hypothetical protein